MTPLDLLNAPEFADPRLTEVINLPPYQTGRPAQLGIFADTPIPTTYVKLGIVDGEITVIPARERGGPGNKNMRNNLAETMLTIPHFPLDDAITPSDLQNLTAYGMNYILQTLGGVVNQKMLSLRQKHDATHNQLDWGALKGQVQDGEGKVLADLFDAFDITQTTVAFALATTTTDVAAKNRAVKAAIRKELRGAPSTGVRVLAGAQWFDAYVNHPSVKAALKDYRGNTPDPGRDDIQDTFSYAGVTLERIDEEFQFRKPDGTFEVQPAVDADEAIAIPLGTPYFKRYIAPPDTIMDANIAPNPANKIFVSTDDLPHGKGRDIHTESNVLPVCTRPSLLIRLTM
ncbi:major capsid protein [Rhodoligotrophos ferricapiens]|uniref:major capsid protein n=1 Tax=Rhodoligotrophos ferricapiens TaxID=3069264 RepID=UPI00315C5A29